jgi:hypothetical protein
LAGCTLLPDGSGIRDADVAYLQGIVAARLTFEEVVRFVVPMTHWWNDRRIASAVADYSKKPRNMQRDLADLFHAAAHWRGGRKQTGSGTAMQDVETRKRYIALAGLILWAQQQPENPEWKTLSSQEQVDRILDSPDLPVRIAAELRRVFGALYKPRHAGLIWTVSLNRRAAPALTKSVPAVKADAARTLFNVNCSEIVWAVIDSGIDAIHPAFRDAKGKQSRIRRSFDFTCIREIVSLDNAHNAKKRNERLKELLKRPLKKKLDREVAGTAMQTLAADAKEGRSIDWELVERFVEVDPEESAPMTNHGTHVAGILGSSRQLGAPAEEETSDSADGMCPDICIYDFRVLAPTLRETEFAIIAALQYIRYVNERNSFITIHGANLSLSIPHDVRNYACGRTPVCNECERLVNSGVVVVAAAGNRGYQNFETKDGLYEGYAAFSVTDPGNTDGVITVGATHRFWPHTYGVSFFSSRGPTGDGRLKPDLVAPGERIRAPLPGNCWGDLDGTSMAAPHVSGAAAMLMARYSELIGQPRRIKQILCDSATDLGRERSFQGHGMLDVLRAFQSI